MQGENTDPIFYKQDSSLKGEVCVWVNEWVRVWVCVCEKEGKKSSTDKLCAFYHNTSLSSSADIHQPKPHRSWHMRSLSLVPSLISYITWYLVGWWSLKTQRHGQGEAVLQNFFTSVLNFSAVNNWTYLCLVNLKVTNSSFKVKAWMSTNDLTPSQ